MKLPPVLIDDHSAHSLLVLLCTANLLLLVLLFFVLVPGKIPIPKITPISAQTPVINFNIVSPQIGSTVSGTVPLVTTLTNGPKIVSAQLFVDYQKVQTVTSQKTQRLTIFWDTTQQADGKHTIVIKVGQDNDHSSSITATFEVKNNVSRNVKK